MAVPLVSMSTRSYAELARLSTDDHVLQCVSNLRARLGAQYGASIPPSHNNGVHELSRHTSAPPPMSTANLSTCSLSLSPSPPSAASTPNTHSSSRDSISGGVRVPTAATAPPPMPPANTTGARPSAPKSTGELSSDPATTALPSSSGTKGEHPGDLTSVNASSPSHSHTANAERLPSTSRGDPPSSRPAKVEQPPPFSKGDLPADLVSLAASLPPSSDSSSDPKEALLQTVFEEVARLRYDLQLLQEQETLALQRENELSAKVQKLQTKHAEHKACLEEGSRLLRASKEEVARQQQHISELESQLHALATADNERVRDQVAATGQHKQELLFLEEQLVKMEAQRAEDDAAHASKIASLSLENEKLRKELAAQRGRLDLEVAHLEEKARYELRDAELVATLSSKDREVESLRLELERHIQSEKHQNEELHLLEKSLEEANLSSHDLDLAREERTAAKREAERVERSLQDEIARLTKSRDQAAARADQADTRAKEAEARATLAESSLLEAREKHEAIALALKAELADAQAQAQAEVTRLMRVQGACDTGRQTDAVRAAEAKVAEAEARARAAEEKAIASEAKAIASEQARTAAVKKVGEHITQNSQLREMLEQCRSEAEEAQSKQTRAEAHAKEKLLRFHSRLQADASAAQSRLLDLTRLLEAQEARVVEVEAVVVDLRTRLTKQGTDEVAEAWKKALAAQYELQIDAVLASKEDLENEWKRSQDEHARVLSSSERRVAQLESKLSDLQCTCDNAQKERSEALKEAKAAREELAACKRGDIEQDKSGWAQQKDILLRAKVREIAELTRQVQALKNKLALRTTPDTTSGGDKLNSSQHTDTNSSLNSSRLSHIENSKLETSSDESPATALRQADVRLRQQASEIQSLEAKVAESVRALDALTRAHTATVEQKDSLIRTKERENADLRRQVRTLEATAASWEERQAARSVEAEVARRQVDELRCVDDEVAGRTAALLEAKDKEARALFVKLRRAEKLASDQAALAAQLTEDVADAKQAFDELAQEHDQRVRQLLAQVKEVSNTLVNQGEALSRPLEDSLGLKEGVDRLAMLLTEGIVSDAWKLAMALLRDDCKRAHDSLRETQSALERQCALQRQQADQLQRLHTRVRELEEENHRLNTRVLRRDYDVPTVEMGEEEMELKARERKLMEECAQKNMELAAAHSARQKAERALAAALAGVAGRATVPHHDHSLAVAGRAVPDTSPHFHSSERGTITSAAALHRGSTNHTDPHHDGDGGQTSAQLGEDTGDSRARSPPAAGPSDIHNTEDVYLPPRVSPSGTSSDAHRPHPHTSPTRTPATHARAASPLRTPTHAATHTTPLRTASTSSKKPSASPSTASLAKTRLSGARKRGGRTGGGVKSSGSVDRGITFPSRAPHSIGSDLSRSFGSSGPVFSDQEKSWTSWGSGSWANGHSQHVSVDSDTGVYVLSRDEVEAAQAAVAKLKDRVGTALAVSRENSRTY